VKFGVIMDVEASRAIRQAEVGTAKVMIERTEERFGIKPEYNDFARRPPCATPGLRNSALQTGFLTGDYLTSALEIASLPVPSAFFGLFLGRG
jgi:hypothetical protein